MSPFWIFSIVFLGLAYLTYNYFSINYLLKSQENGLTRHSNGKCVRVAVFENVPFGVYNGSQKPGEIINKNLEKYEKAIKLASKENVKLLVFPEDSLLNSERFSRRVLIDEILEEMPSPEKGGRLVNPCLEIKDDSSVVSARESVLRRMSCQAREHSMYIAYSFGDKVPCTRQNDSKCPEDGHYLYNSIALLDDAGNFVSKYHKMQLYYEYHYNIPSDCPTHFKPVVFYDSPFGRLGFLVCYDLLFHSPAIDLVEKYHVDSIIYSTYWFNYVPFVGALQMQQAFAIRHKVNFLASNVQTDDSSGLNLGLGIYSGTRGALAYSNTADGQSKLIIATIPVNSKSPNAGKMCPPEPKKVLVSQTVIKSKAPNFQLNVSLVKVIPLPAPSGHEFVEQCCPYSGICCSLSYQVKNVQQFSKEHFVLIFGNSTSGALGQERYPIRQEFCGFSACEDSKCKTFASQSQTYFSYIRLEGKMSSHSYCYPGVTTSTGLLPVQEWKFKSEGDKHSISMSNLQEPVVAVTLYGRLYKADPPYKH